MTGTLHYKGYSAKPEFSAEDRIFYGKVLGISDLVDFYTEDAKELVNEFHQAVDDYLEFCKDIGKEPQKAYSGSFNVRITPELHRKAVLCAQAEGMTLNKLVDTAIRCYLEDPEHTFSLSASTKSFKTAMELPAVQNDSIHGHPYSANCIIYRQKGGAGIC